MLVFLIVLILHIKAIKIAATGNVSGSNDWFGFWGTVWSIPVGSVLLFELEVYSYSLWVVANWLFIGFIAGVIISLYDLAIEKLPPRRLRF